MEIRFYNTLTSRAEVFQPVDSDCVRMYSAITS